MKKTKLHILGVSIAVGLALTGCTSQQIATGVGVVNDVLKNTGGTLTPTNDEIVKGLKEALVQGISKGSGLASQTDGYLKNGRLKIPFPPDTKKMEANLRSIGLGNQVDKFIETLNRGAEDAAKSALPVFKDAITKMSVQDAMSILKGDKDAATQYLRKTTEAALMAQYKPIVQQSLDKVNATKYWGELVTKYNQIPLVEKVNPDLNAFASQKAIDGLFLLVKDEEANIRDNIAARTSDLLKKVFGYATSGK
jgi:hypothetical protein